MRKSNSKAIWKNKWKEAGRAAVLRYVQNLNYFSYFFSPHRDVDSLAISESCQPPYSSELIFEAINQLSKEEVQARGILQSPDAPSAITLEMVEARAKHLVKVKTHEQPKEVEWTFVFPLPLNQNTSIDETIDCLGIEFRITSFDAIAQLFPQVSFNNLFNESEVTTPNLSSISFAVASLKTDQFSNILSACDKAEEAYCAFCGTVDLVISVTNRTVFTKHRVRPGHFPHPPWIVGIKDAVEADILLLSNSPDKLIFSKATTKTLSQAKYLLDRINKHSGDSAIGITIARSLRLYSQALNEERRHATFLELWKVMEEINRAGREHTKHDDTVGLIRLIARMTLNSGTTAWPQIQVAVNHLNNLRNLMTHHGTGYGTPHSSVDLLRSLCESALMWMIHNIELIQSQQGLQLAFLLGKNSDKRNEFIRLSNHFPQLLSLIETTEQESDEDSPSGEINEG